MKQQDMIEALESAVRALSTIGEYDPSDYWGEESSLQEAHRYHGEMARSAEAEVDRVLKILRGLDR